MIDWKLCDVLRMKIYSTQIVNQRYHIFNHIFFVFFLLNFIETDILKKDIT